MTESANFDAKPDAFLEAYDTIVSRVNVGYDLIFILTLAILQAQRNPDLHLLVIGAGGGKEVRTFLPPHPGWHLTGVDPSAKMLATTQQHADALGVHPRVKLIQGYLQDVDRQPVFDAATCMFVLQFLPDNGEKVALLREIARRLSPGAPLILVDACPTTGQSGAEDLFAVVHEYGVLVGMRAEQMAAIMDQIRVFPTGVSMEREEELLYEAGFAEVTRFYTGVMIHGWIARTPAAIRDRETR